MRLLGRLGMRYAFFFMGAVALIYAVVHLIVGSSLFIPHSADGVLDSVSDRSSYTWSSESVRLVTLGGHLMRQDAARGAIVDLDQNKFQVQVAGVLPDRSYYDSDGNYTISLTDSDEQSGVGWQLVTDVCNGAPAIKASTLEMPSPDDFKAADPSLETDQGTVFGQQAWVIDFKATPTIVEKLLWLPFFDAALKNDPDTEQWVISDSERKKIEAGDFKTISGKVWVNRNGTRLIQQIDLKIQIDGGSKYRFLAQNVQTTDSDPLSSLSLGKANCG